MNSQVTLGSGNYGVSLTVTPSGVLTAGLVVPIANGSVINDGAISNLAGYDNSGSLIAGGVGVSVSAAATVTNAASGTIGGGAGVAGYSGFDGNFPIQAGPGGTGGAGGAGIFLSNSATFVNSGNVKAGEGGAGGYGGYGGNAGGAIGEDVSVGNRGQCNIEHLHREPLSATLRPHI